MKILIRILTVIVILFSVTGGSGVLGQENKEKHDQHKEDSHKSSFPELDKFHQLLHPIWHENYPKNEWKEIRAKSEALVRRKNEVMKVELHKYVKAEDEKTAEELRTKFGTAVDRLAAAAKSGTDDELKKSVAEMHEAFEKFAEAVS